MDEYSSEKAKIKSIIRDSLANDNGHTSQNPLLRYMCMMVLLTLNYLHQPWEKYGSNDVFID